MDVKFARSQFPSLARSDWVLLDNAGGSQTLRAVADRITDYLLSTNVQLGASYGTSVNAANRVKSGTVAVSQLINAKEVYEVIFASSTSLAMENIARALGPTLTKGQEIIITNFDHEANAGPWVRMAEQFGAVLKIWEIDRTTLRPDINTLKRLLSSKTRLVCCTHVSNILGSINDVKSIAAAVHTIPGAELCVDAVAFSPHRLVDVQDFNADYYVFSFYKVYGPHCAVIYGKREALHRIASLNHFFLPTNEPALLPYKLQPGSVNYELTYSLTAVLEYLVGLGKGTVVDKLPTDTNAIRAALKHSFDLIAEHEEKLGKVLLDFLASKKHKGVRVIGEPSADRRLRVPTISFVVPSRKSSDIVNQVDSKNIGIRWGHFYSKRLIDYLGLDPVEGVVRVSLVHYNTIEEVQRLVAVLDDVIEQKPSAKL